MSGLHIPDCINQLDTLTAALAYADAGWYVLPVRLDHPDRSKRKSPGSIVGAHWPSLSSRDPQQITAWFAGTSHGIALHVGRSGAVVLDVDHPQHTHDVVLAAMETSGCPHQSTRDTPARGHYLFANTTGRRIGNSLGKLATTPAWGEVRGANGVIIVAPSIHPGGGHYHWQRTGVLPPLPDYLDEALPDSVTPENTASDTQVREFLDHHTQSDRPEALKGLVNTLTAKLAGGASCHMSTLGIVTDAMAEAAAGLYPAREAWEALRRVFLDTATTGTSTGRILTESEATGEYAGIVAWAIGQAETNSDKAREKVAKKYSDGSTEVAAAKLAAVPGDDDQDDDGPPRLAAWLLNRSALRDLPDPAPLIEDVLDQGTVALLYGRWGSGKSFIAYDLAASVATGRAWQGRQSAQRPVLYVAAEGAFGMKGRTAAWETGWHLTISDDQLAILPRPVNLTNHAEVRDLAALIDWGGYGLVVIDTLARCMVGADENSAKDCGQVVDALTRLREATPGGRGVVLGVHHTGKDGRTFRGSSVFEAGADTVYAVTLDGPTIQLDREKRKDGPQADTHRLRLDPVQGTGSCTVSAGNLSTWGWKNSERGGRLMNTFVQHFVHTGASKAELRNVAEMPSATFHRALSDLLESGDLVNEGTDKRPFYKKATK